MGRSRLEPLSVIACACIMSAASLEVVQFSAMDLYEGLQGASSSGQQLLVPAFIRRLRSAERVKIEFCDYSSICLAGNLQNAILRIGLHLLGFMHCRLLKSVSGQNDGIHTRARHLTLYMVFKTVPPMHGQVKDPP